MWIGTPDGDDWREIGEVRDFETEIRPKAQDSFLDAVTRIQDEIVIETELASNVYEMLELVRSFTSAQEQLYRSVMIVGTRKLAHAKPAQRGTWFRRWMPEFYATAYATKRVEHARARKLYSERLRRDRRRQRKGRAPILRSGPDVRTLFPRVKVDEATRRGDIVGMRMVASPHLDTGQVAVFDTQLLDRAMQERPILQYEEPLKDVARDYIRGYSATLFAFDETRKFTGLDPS
jgi:hypothetical protein